MANQPHLRKATEFGEITQWYLRRSRPFKVTDFGTNRKLPIDRSYATSY